MAQLIEPVRLIGNPEENFYVLGKKHQVLYQALRDKIYPADNQLINHLGRLTERFRRAEQVTLPSNTWGGWLKAYCEGLEVSPARYLAFLDDMESEAMPYVLAGCTSAFRWDQHLQLGQHLRLVDWPRALLSETDCEVIYVESPKKTSLVLITVPGLPFLPLTAMNSHGLTVAMHAKYHALVHGEGQCIGEAVIEGLMHAQSTLDLRKHIKTFQSKHFWGLHALDQSGEVLAIDILGPRHDVTTHSLTESRLLVFNNAPLVKAKEESHQPANFTHFCKLKRESAIQRLSGEINEHPLLALTRARGVSKDSAPAVTLSTIQSLCLTPASRSLDFVIGRAPQWFQGKIQSYKNLFQTGMRESHTQDSTFTKEEQLEWSIRHYFSEAQRSMDLGDQTAAFHYLQMGLAQARGETLKAYEWVWAWWQWKHLTGRRDRLLIYQDISAKLPIVSAHWKGHLSLLRFIIELDLGLSPTVTPMDFSGQLKTWSEKFLSAPQLMRSQWLKQIEARLDIQDLILPWTNPL